MKCIFLMHFYFLLMKVFAVAHCSWVRFMCNRKWHSRFLNFLQPSGWRKVRNMVQWTPFVQTFKNRKYQWVQLAGHSGNFKAGRNQGTVLKKLCPQEEKCYSQFSNDSIAPYVPEYQGTLILDNDESEFLTARTGMIYI